MVFIKKLSAKGFKSFGQRRLSLTFDRGLNVITGPNGSGKSNIIDALSFCLGESRPRSLRVDRLHSLITDDGRTKGLRVTLKLDNSDRGIPIDRDEVVISRELKASGESSYYINGRRVGKREYLDLLEVSLLRPTMLNLIQQGVVTRISELSPEEKRRLVEDAVGISQFDEKEREAMEQLKAADQKLEVVLARSDEQRRRLLSLEVEMNELMAFRHLEREIRQLEAVRVSDEIRKIEAKLERLGRSLSTLEPEYEKVNSELKALKAKLEEAEAERSRFIQEVMDPLSSKRFELRAKIVTQERRSALLKGEIEAHKGEMERLESEIERLKEEMAERSKAASRLESELSSLNERLEALLGERGSTLKELNSLRAAKGGVEKKLARLKKELELREERIGKYEERMRKLLLSLAILGGKRRMMLERMNALGERIKSLKQIIEGLESEVDGVGRIKEEYSEKLRGLDGSIRSFRDLKKELESQIGRAIGTLEKAEEGIREFEVNARLAKCMDEDSAYRTLMKLKRDGLLDGLLGRLGELISYDEGYRAAVEAVGKRWLKALVVRDLKSSVKVVEAVKRLKLGRVTILAVKEAKGPRPKGVKVAGVLGPLSKFVKCGEEIRPLVDALFGGFMLTSSLTSAYMVSGLGVSAVTLRGEVMEPRGRVIEAGRRYELKVEAIDERELTESSKAIRELRRRLKEKVKALGKLDDRLGRLEKERLARLIELSKLSSSVKEVKRVLSHYKRVLSRAEREYAALERAKSRLDKKIERAGKAVERVKAKLDSARAPEKASRLEELKRRLEGLNERESELQGRLKSLESELSNLYLTKSRLESELSSLKSELSLMKSRSEEYSRELERRERAVAESEEKLSRISTELEALRKEEDSMKSEFESAKERLKAYELRVKGLRDEIDALTSKLLKLDREMNSIRKDREHEELELRRKLEELEALGYREPLEPFYGYESVLSALKEEYDELKLRVNLLSLKQYEELYEDFKFLSDRVSRLQIERDAIVRFIERVEEEKRNAFMKALRSIDTELRAIFSRLTNGRAWLELEKPETIFDGGLFLITQFPNKPPREATSVSGGEKTIAALSFLLAMQSVFPSPIYMFDEVDAHLDEVNLKRLGELLKDKAKGSQMIVVSLKDVMVSMADRLIGVYLEDGMTKAVGYRPRLEVSQSA